VIEPLAIGLVLVPGTHSLMIACAGLCGFLAYRPVTLAAGDLLKKKRYPRTVPALIAGLLLGLVGLALVSVVWWQTQAARLPLEAAVCLGALFAAIDKRAKPRSLWRELLGSILSIPVLIAILSGGFGLPSDEILAFVGTIGPLFLLRAVVTVLTVRSVIGRFSDATLCRWGAVMLALPMLYCVRFMSLASDPGYYAYGIVATRAMWFALTPGKERAARNVGLQELAVSALIVLSWNWPAMAFHKLMNGG